MINNLELKLQGLEPITRRELILLINSWGRKERILTNDNIFIHKSEPKECYDLSNLDVSQITDMSLIFYNSFYDGNLSNWNTSNVTNMKNMFFKSIFNNDSLNTWNTSSVTNMAEMFQFSNFNQNISNWNTTNVTTMDSMFYHSKFNADLSNWNVSSVIDMDYMFSYSKFDNNISNWKFNSNCSCLCVFHQNKNFENKYNNDKPIPYDTEDFLKWFQDNKINISSKNISNQEILEINDYLNDFKILEIN